MERTLRITHPAGRIVLRALAATSVALIAAFGLNVAYQHFVVAVWDGTAPVPGNWYRRAIFFAVCFLALLPITLKPLIAPAKLGELVFRFRWAIGALIFVGCVVLQLHGSSLGVWNLWVQPTAPPVADASAILGTLRAERTDEFMVNTPLAFSQAFTGYAPTNSIAEAWPTNMLTVYNQPALDLTLIAKPFYWGYILLGSARGLAWFWCGRIIALFLVTFEMFRVLTNDKRIWAVAAACMITFAPIVQWWFAVNFLVEMLVFGQLAVLSAIYFMRTAIPSDSSAHPIRPVARKLIWSLICALSLSAYLFALYPAWMVPLAYLFAILFVWAVVTNFRAAPRRLSDWLYPLLVLAIVGAMMAYWYFQNRDAIAIVRGTVYPGQRQETGGGAFLNLFTYWRDLILPYIHTNNYSGGAVFPGFFPIGEILAIALLAKTRCKDGLLIALLCLNAFLIVYAGTGFPMWLAKITLLSYSHAWAVAIVSTGISLFILIRALSGWLDIAATSARNHATQRRFVEFLKGRALTHALPACLIAFALISGVPVNPLMRGISAVTGKPLYAELQRLQAEDPGAWIATWPAGNYTIMAGAPTINSTNIIPALGRWEMLDPDHQHMDVYNRYAHVVIGFNTTKTTFSQPGEIIGVDLAMTDLHALGVKYICLNDFGGNGPQDLPTLSWAGGHAVLIYSEYQVRIFKIEYDS